MGFRFDWLLFGNGHGMASPYFDDAFYWLADLNRDRTNTGRHSRFYRVSFGLGAQLTSYEWRTPRPGMRRRLAGRDFVIFSTSRRWFRVECNWAAVGARSVEEVSAVVAAVKAWRHGP